MGDMVKQKGYLSYLLRLWRENDQDRPQWRASLESTQDSERQSFASLDDLLTFLRQETGNQSTSTINYQTTSQLKE
jgi:hypothetical protein